MKTADGLSWNEKKEFQITPDGAAFDVTGGTGPGEGGEGTQA